VNDPEFERWYGRWEPLGPESVVDFMAGFDRLWWVIGGWALEAFTGVARPHDDLDISLFAADVEAFRQFLRGRWTPWNVDDGWFRPFDDDHTEIEPESQLWIRRDAASPWVLDLPLTIGTPGADGALQWTHKRFHDVVLPLDEATWVADDGLRHLRPELALSIKARLDRDKDRADLEAALPLLDDDARARLWAMVERAHPGHAWLTTYAGEPRG
jgi:hypothetical protein